MSSSAPASSTDDNQAADPKVQIHPISIDHDRPPDEPWIPRMILLMHPILRIMNEPLDLPNADKRRRRTGPIAGRRWTGSSKSSTPPWPRVPAWLTG